MYVHRGDSVEHGGSIFQIKFGILAYQEEKGRYEMIFFLYIYIINKFWSNN